HEAGHALATKLLTNDSISKVTIVASTSGAEGVTIRTPQDRSLYSKKYIESLVKIMYAGRVAEQLFLKSKDEITTGASNDIKQATALIKDYVTLYGMDDDIGLINLSMFKTLNDEMLIRKMSDISKKLYKETEDLLYNNYEKLELIADKLLEKESITEAELNQLLDVA
ncbi:MAG: ATP-dependent metallopeptidase FtsH/Yme1/Tma family protein, partial [Thermoanaerobacteraceae bacterium]|nr:ATP-dependent metallopeptidase FtsH/Yme1/Tma family protein [Thermoanaerobacteraceae bacterium]